MNKWPEVAREWEGRVVDGKFPLRQCLGGSAHSAVFATDRGDSSQKAAIKLIAADHVNDDAQIARWKAAGKFPHPNLIRLFEAGRCELDGRKLLYVVMEWAEEVLSQVLPVRALTSEEASEMLKATAGALASLHRAGLAHGGIQPSNIMAVQNELKLSADRVGARGDASPGGAYEAPEVAAKGISPEADLWSLGATLVAVMTQKEPVSGRDGRKAVPATDSIQQPFREIARECLRDDGQRWTAEQVIRRLQSGAAGGGAMAKAAASTTSASAAGSGEREMKSPVTARQGSRWWLLVAIAVVALALAAWIAFRGKPHGTEETPASAPGTPPSSPEKAAPGAAAKTSTLRGSIAQQAMPEVSRGAQNTVQGRVKVGVKVSVDESGNVTDATFETAGPSKYFAERSMAAARKWKFKPPQVDGRAVSSQWVLRFQIGRATVEGKATQTKP